MKVLLHVVLLLPLLVHASWTDKYSTLFKNITSKFNRAAADSREQHREQMNFIHREHGEVKTLVGFLKKQISTKEKVTEKEIFELVQTLVEKFDKNIESWKNQEAEAKSEIKQTRFEQTEEIKKILLDTLKKYVSDAPESCYDLYETGVRENGVYAIKPRTMTKYYSVYCDMEKGGWTVIQRRDYYAEKKEDFNTTWEVYKEGFGDPTGEFWLGNEAIHRMTKDDPNYLAIEVTNFENQTSYAGFGSFYLENEDDRYRLKLREGTHFQKESILRCNGERFSTVDRILKFSCEENWGGWWYPTCKNFGNLNALHGNTEDYKRITIDGRTPLTSTVMKIRPKG